MAKQHQISALTSQSDCILNTRCTASDFSSHLSLILFVKHRRQAQDEGPVPSPSGGCLAAVVPRAAKDRPTRRPARPRPLVSGRWHSVATWLGERLVRGRCQAARRGQRSHVHGTAASDTYSLTVDVQRYVQRFQFVIGG